MDNLHVNSVKGSRQEFKIKEMGVSEQYTMEFLAPCRRFRVVKL